MSRTDGYKIKHSQNFLVNKKLIRRLVADADFQSDETVVEIGPGRGIITRELARGAGHVIGIEHDHALATKLAGQMPSNVTIIWADALEFPMPTTPFRVFANIPFRHTAAIVGKLTTGKAPPAESRLVMQRDAAVRFMIGKESTMRALQLAPFLDVRILHAFDRSDFAPRPGVESVLLLMERKPAPLVEPVHSEIYSMFIDAVFSSWQPTLESALKAALPRLAAQDIIANKALRSSRTLKPSAVEPTVWIEIFRALVARNDDRVWKELSRASSRNNANRQQLERPTRTNTRRSGVSRR